MVFVFVLFFVIQVTERRVAMWENNNRKDVSVFSFLISDF